MYNVSLGPSRASTLQSLAQKNSCMFALFTATLFLLFLFFGLPAAAQVPDTAQPTQYAKVDTTGAGDVIKVAPGEMLPVSVKLSNFGGSARIDVTISYKIIDLAGRSIYTSTETVAVQTTANFVRTIQIPFNTPSGRYIAQSSIIYQGQVTPATTEFPYMVEYKIFGLFLSDFYLYGGIMLLVSFIVGVISHVWRRRRRSTRLVTLDYSNIPHDKRIFYEILSDTILGMRQRVGDQALVIAANIDGLKIDEKTSRVVSFTGPPSKVITTLVAEYEKLLGKRVSFSLRQ